MFTIEADNTCPWCGKKTDRVTNLTTDHSPRPLDFSLCFYCGNIARYTAELKLRRAVAIDFNDLRHEQKVELARASILARMRIAGEDDSHTMKNN